MHSRPAMLNNVQAAEVVARQGMRLPQIVLKRLRDAGIYCQPTLSLEYQKAVRKHVLRGVESGGAVGGLGAYSSLVGERGESLAWLQRVDSIGVNGVHAVVVAPKLLRLEMVRIERTYDLLVTRHWINEGTNGVRPRLQSSIVFYGRRGSLEMELWGKDSAFRGAVCPAFYTRAGEGVTLPEGLQEAIARMTAAVCCLQCRHCHVLGPKMTGLGGVGENGLYANIRSASRSALV
jgi:hypothetical protein